MRAGELGAGAGDGGRLGGDYGGGGGGEAGGEGGEDDAGEEYVCQDKVGEGGRGSSVPVRVYLDM